MSKENKDAPPLPPRLPLPIYPTNQKRRNLRKSSLDVVPPPPFPTKKSTNQINNNNTDDNHLLLNLPNSLLEQQQLQSISTTKTNQTIGSTNAIYIDQTKTNHVNNAFNNNYYGINCNYFTVPNKMSLSSLSNSPNHNYVQLSHSNSYPNFNPPLQNQSSITLSITSTITTTITTSTTINTNLNKLNNHNNPSTNQQILTNQMTNAINNNQLLPSLNACPLLNYTTTASSNLDNLNYQQFVISKLRNLSTNQIKKLSNDNLIDLGPKDDLLFDENNANSVLNIFDPLFKQPPPPPPPALSNNKPDNQQVTYSTIKETIRSTINDDEELTNSMKSIHLKRSEQLTEENFYESINYEKPSSSTDTSSNKLELMIRKEIIFNNNLDYLKHRNLVANNEIINFKQKLSQLRTKFKWNDERTNCGFVISSRLKSPKDTCLSVKLVIDNEFAQSICFTCNISTSVEHVVCHTVCSIFDSSTVNFSDYILKVFGLNEFLINDSCLGDYRYVNECHKFDKDVKLTLIDRSKTKIDFYARTEIDDEKIENLNEYDILPNLLLCKFNDINYENVKIFLDIIDIEAQKLITNNTRTNTIEYFDTGKFLRTNQQETAQSILISVGQAVKALCSYLGFETIELIGELNNLKALYLDCEHYRQNSTNRKLNETIEIVIPEVIGNAILKMKRSIFVMLNLYSKVFPVNFICELPESERLREEQRELKTIDDFKQDSLICSIKSLNELNCDWSTKYQLFYLKCELIHGERVLACANTNRMIIENVDKSPRIVFNDVICFEDQLICNLPRETYLYFTLIGVSQIGNQNNTIDDEYNEIGITSIRLFDQDNILIRDDQLLGLWPEKYCASVYKTVIRESFLERGCPLLVFSLVEINHLIKFPDLNYSSVKENDDFKSSLDMFDANDHANIYYILNQDPLDQLSYEDKQTLWEKRFNLTLVPSALPKILSSVPSWQSTCLLSIYKLIRSFSDLPAIDAMQLLLPSYADCFVREMAIKYIRKLDDDEINDYLPQLVHAIRYETNLDSPLIWLLFEKSYSNLRIAHHLYWLLKTSLNDQLISWRMQVLLNAFLSTCSSSLKQTLKNEEKLLDKLNAVSDQLKKEKDDRLKNLRENLENVHCFLMENETSLPLDLSMQITGLDLQSCNYFNSNTLPIKIVFKTDIKQRQNSSSSLALTKYKPSTAVLSPSSIMPSFNQFKQSTIDALYKVGDDLRQDNITMQMIDIMDKLWLKEGLDLKLITFKCIATDERKGFVEMVKNSETLRRIQGEKGVTGSFKDNSIATWLQKYNTSELEYEQAVNNFTSSCAGYAVATYVLGIGDRHNDNIMLTTAGHLFHIDFGKFLGDAQMIGTIKRDRVPFVLTSDMAYVINNGDKVTIKFQNFIDLCCQAYNIIRQNSNLFLSLFSLMLSADIPGLTSDAIKYVHNALKPTLTNCKASEEFNNLIIEALSSKATQINFFIHNLAQLRFSSDYNDQNFLSFAPKIHTMETDNEIKGIKIECIRKLEDPQNKQYYYVFLVSRINQKDAQRILRTYKEVYELNQKLNTFFRLVKFYPLPRPKSNSREFTEKKLREVKIFFEDLMQTANEILHCDLVYTFFHPLLRDQEISNQYQDNQLFRGTLQAGYSSNIINRANHSGNGELKLSILYKNGVLMIMIMHARDLYSNRASEPDTYVKTYLLPDPYKETKRKTKVIYKSKHPTFLEMITYDIPMKKLNEKQLEVSVWYYLFGDREKKLLGATLIQLNDLDLRKEIVQWWPLTINKN